MERRSASSLLGFLMVVKGYLIGRNRFFLNHHVPSHFELNWNQKFRIFSTKKKQPLIAREFELQQTVRDRWTDSIEFFFQALLISDRFRHFIGRVFLRTPEPSANQIRGFVGLWFAPSFFHAMELKFGVFFLRYWANLLLRAIDAEGKGVGRGKMSQTETYFTVIAFKISPVHPRGPSSCKRRFSTDWAFRGA